MKYSYRRCKYDSYGSTGGKEDKAAFIGLVVVLICSPFIAGAILNPYMWAACFMVWLAWKLIYGGKGK